MMMAMNIIIMVDTGVNGRTKSSSIVRSIEVCTKLKTSLHISTPPCRFAPKPVPTPLLVFEDELRYSNYVLSETSLIFSFRPVNVRKRSFLAGMEKPASRGKRSAMGRKIALNMKVGMEVKMRFVSFAGFQS